MAGLEDVKSGEQTVEITLAGKKYPIRYDMNAFGVLEKKFGTVEAAMNSLSEGKLGDVKYLLWAGIIHDQVESFDEETGEPLKYKITPYQVGAAIHSPAAMADVIEDMTKALVASMPTEDPNEGKPEKAKTRAPRGSKNTPSASAKKN